MPKILDYPRAALSRAIEVAQAVDALGGQCTLAMCADQMGRKVGGAFKTDVGATAKYGLITSARQKLAVTQMYRDFKLAYTEADRQDVLKSAFLSIPVFQELTDRFAGKQIPVDILDKLLIREFGVTDQEARRVGGYFLEGAFDIGLIDEDRQVIGSAEKSAGSNAVDDNEGDVRSSDGISVISSEVLPQVSIPTDRYSIMIRGPGMNTEIVVSEPDDLIVVEAILKKVRKSLETDGDDKDADG